MFGCTVTPLAAEQQTAADTSGQNASATTASADAAGSDEYKAPSAVKLTAKRVNGTTIKLSWNKCDGADYYLLYYVNSQGKAYKRICTTGKLSYTDTAKSSDPGYSLKINAKSAYTYMIIARNVTDRGYYNSTDTAYVGTGTTQTTQTTTTSQTGDDNYTAPSAVTVTGKRVNGTTIRLSWNKCDGADYYLVYYVNSKGKAYKRICTTRKLTYTDTAKSSDPGHSLKINANSSYTYMVIARNVTDRGSYNSTDKVYVRRLAARKRLMEVAKAQLGKGYSQARRTGPKTFDCSGYVWYCYNKSKASKKSFSAYNTNGLYSHLKKYKRSSNNIRYASQGDIVLYGSSTSNTTHAALVYNAKKGTVINAANPRKGVCYGKSSWYGRVVAIIHLPDNN